MGRTAQGHNDSAERVVKVGNIKKKKKSASLWCIKDSCTFMISYYFIWRVYILRIYETSNNMCILFDTALKKKDVYVLFSPILLTICYNPYPKNKQTTCHVFLHLNSTQASPEGDAFAAICTQRRRAGHVISWKTQGNAEQIFSHAVFSSLLFPIKNECSFTEWKILFFFTEH